MNAFKLRRFHALVILQCVRWYSKYAVSYRQLEEMMAERGVAVDHTTIWRWIQHYAPRLERAHADDTAHKQHAFENARCLFEKIIQIDPYCVEALNNLGVALCELDHYRMLPVARRSGKSNVRIKRLYLKCISKSMSHII
jgi:hypothetical protein